MLKIIWKQKHLHLHFTQITPILVHVNLDERQLKYFIKDKLS